MPSPCLTSRCRGLLATTHWVRVAALAIKTRKNSTEAVRAEFTRQLELALLVADRLDLTAHRGELDILRSRTQARFRT